MDENTNHLIDVTWAAEHAGFTRPAMITGHVYDRIVKPHMMRLLRDEVLWSVLWPLRVDINTQGDNRDEIFYEDQYGNALWSTCRNGANGNCVITIDLAEELRGGEDA